MLILFWQVVLGLLINKWVAMELPMNCHLISGAINKILLVRNGRSTPREGHNLSLSLSLPPEKKSFGFSLQKFGGLKQPSSNGTFSFNGLKSCCWYCPVLYTYLVPPQSFDSSPKNGMLMIGMLLSIVHWKESWKFVFLFQMQKMLFF